ncbi:cobaltochelatase subunit CobN [Aquabacterium sp. OR-4]|uniref:cobaltochelatase subunit CobN n=1 Tax=Aquabacterium sp. OR-4 TaxID=2978127 RepID=UPI0021B34817|nr:cobaltochelatase subunit CobN [Aquabacterium sp. OR-4]MDT7838104.1 cobaltochelatase subunit CobN [Aquabacterium sp. OR-4]
MRPPHRRAPGRWPLLRWPPLRWPLLRWLLLAALPWLLVMLCLARPVQAAPGAPAPAPVTLAGAPGGVLLLTTSPSPPGRFVALVQQAQAMGLPLRAEFVEKLPAEALNPRLWQGTRLVLIDAPRQHIEDFVRGKLGAALPALQPLPHVWLATAAPKAGGGLDAELARRLHGYFVQGGKANTEHLLRSLAAHLAGRDWRALPPPQVFPTAGLYHPALAQTVVATPAEWLAARGIDPARRPPTVGIVFHPGSIAAQQTGFIDDLVQRIEAAGAVALPFYTPVMDPDALRRMVTVNGQPVVEALVNTQITLNPEGRRQELAALGVPVIQAMAWRRGSEAQWAADPQGVPLIDVPFYLAQAEYAGITDIQVAMATRAGDEAVVPIAAQAAAVAAKALNLATLRRLPPADKRVAIFFWNYPAGEKNLSASFMNLPRSLSGTLAALQGAGYRTEALAEAPLTAALQRLLAPGYRPPDDRAVLQQLLRDGLAERLPVADYRRWLAGLPPSVGDALRARWGEPERSTMVLRDPAIDAGAPFFVIPRLRLGQVSLLPQPGRDERGSDKEKSIYHSSSALPTHHYLAVYLWARQAFGAQALVHYGTHGTQEWLPGKERGLSVFDWPMLAVGDTPVIYPYIVDNIGEATQAKRRGRAVILSHQTPPLVPAGLHDKLTRLHDLLHQWLAQDGGGVKEQLRAEFLAGVRAERIQLDMGWSEARIAADFAGFVAAVHDHLHELALTVQPMGLHTFGQGADERWRVAQVLTMLGQDFWQGVADPANPSEEADELLVVDHTRLTESKPYRLLAAHLRDGTDIPQLPPAAREKLKQARQWYQDLGAQNEQRALLAALDGRHIPTSYGGDPIKNPDALPTGRNLYGFDPSRVPTPAAWAAGQQAMDALIATHRAKTGRMLAKTTLTLWSVETMRHFGLLEAQALWALGVEPQWDAGGRVTGVKLIPRERLGRPRVDVVLSATGLYRDHFPNVMKQLAEAARLAAQDTAASAEADNPVAANARRISANLQRQGVPAAEAQLAGATRIFASESGRYGTGLDDAALATDTWKTQGEGDRKLAELYLRRMQFAYGPDESRWGQAGVSTAGALNLYAEHLRGTEAAVLSRSSNLYGLLTTDDPFQYLGGIGLAVRHLDGAAPELYVSNLRGNGAGSARVEGAAQFLAKELATRNFHPGHIQGLMAEGYAGTLAVLDGINNFAGWQSVAREVVRHDQWQEFMDVYVRDKHQLGLQRWFAQHNPHALAQSIERMLEAARLGQWQASAASVAELKARYNELAQAHQVRSDNASFRAYVAAGFGTAAPAPAQAAAPGATPAATRPADAPAPHAPTAPPQPPPAPPPQATAPVQGLRLERVPPKAPDSPAPLAPAALALLALAMAGGAWQARRRSPARASAAPILNLLSPAQP